MTSVRSAPSAISLLVASREASCCLACNTSALFFRHVYRLRAPHDHDHKDNATSYAPRIEVPSNKPRARTVPRPAPSLERRMSGDCLGNGPSELRDLDLCERKGAKTGLVIIFSLLLSPVSPSAPFFLLLFSLSFEWVQRPIKERAAAAAIQWKPSPTFRLSWLPPSFLPSSFTHSLSRLSLKSCSLSLGSERVDRWRSTNGAQT